MKKIQLRSKKYWKVDCVSSPDILVVGAVISAAGLDWEADGYSSIRIYSGKKKARQLQSLISGMSEVGVLKGSISMEVTPHR